MATEDFKRKLTTLFSADVAGYSRLMGQDEAATVETITTYREVMSVLIKQHRGRVVDSPGDNLLAEFNSVVDAVQCAVAAQKELKARNAELREDRRMEFRIGINLGDVIEEEDRIYGDGVNIAARLEGLAAPGGICVSKTAFDQIETKLPLGYEYLGEQTIKNIAKPVGAYHVLMEPRITVSETIEEKRVGAIRRPRLILAVVVALLMVAGAVAMWNFYLRPSPPPAEVVSEKAQGLELPDKPSIAVLPFVNMSGDPEQEYFSDGITEEIITTLSKVPQLFVIARNSVFTYKGKSVKIQQVGKELGVRYVLEGSVRKAEDRVRITAQLVDAATGGHLWSERYDRDLKDIFALQDEITIKILTAVRVKLTEGEQAHLHAKGVVNLDSFMKVMQGVPYFYRFNREGNIQARQIFEEAIALDPKNPGAYTLLGWTYLMEMWFGLSESPGKSMARAAELAQKALALNDTLDLPHSLLGNIYLLGRQYEKAVAEAERAVALNPNGADAHAHLGMTLNYVGRRKEAIALLTKAIRLNPIPPTWYLFTLGEAYFLAGQYEEAVAAYKRVLHDNPDDMRAHTGLASAYGLLGQEKEARAAAEEVLRVEPKFSVEYVKTLPFKNKADKELLIEALRKAGLK
jgi:adenylate cyclase